MPRHGKDKKEKKDSDDSSGSDSDCSEASSHDSDARDAEKQNFTLTPELKKMVKQRRKAQRDGKPRVASRLTRKINKAVALQLAEEGDSDGSDCSEASSHDSDNDQAKKAGWVMTPELKQLIKMRRRAQQKGEVRKARRMTRRIHANVAQQQQQSKKKAAAADSDSDSDSDDGSASDCSEASSHDSDNAPAAKGGWVMTPQIKHLLKMRRAAQRKGDHVRARRFNRKIKAEVAQQTGAPVKGRRAGGRKGRGVAA